MNDSDVWGHCPIDWLWIYDKLIVARKQGILAAPAGISVPSDGEYIIRPITNIRMMGRGARKIFIHKDDDSAVPDGYFWSEILQGPHLSVDYYWGQIDLTVQGFKDSDRLDRFCLWRRVDTAMPLPPMLQALSRVQKWINIEYIGSKIIEIHLRYNDDFRNHNSDEIIPVWTGQDTTPPKGYGWYDNAWGDRLGFWILNK